VKVLDLLVRSQNLAVTCIPLVDEKAAPRYHDKWVGLHPVVFRPLIATIHRWLKGTWMESST
jgi:hypothetical protein